ncbi:MAG: methyltransferase domain-containing protein [Bacteroidales bacterium]|nr:methyltransferase domain-containing protein [Bacteroidales bacterium]
MKPTQHKAAFDRIYKCSSYEGDGLRFPLLDIDNYDWKRGVGNNKYFSYFYRRFSCHILSRLALSSDNQKILVVGCGAGSDEKNIRNINNDVELWSIDISEEMLKKAIAGKSPSYFSLGIAEKLPFPNNSFDRVISREVIEHVINPQLMLNEIYRVLKPEGIAIVATENDESYSPTNFFHNYINDKISKLLNYSYSRGYKDKAPTLAEMKSYCKNADLTLIEYFYDGALYKYLPAISSVTKTNLANVAHFFSSLENNSRIARIYCDQVKYVLRKNADAKYSYYDKISYVCPRCHSKLNEVEDSFVCSKCNNTYPIINGIPNFLIDDDIVEKDADIKDNNHVINNNFGWRHTVFMIIKYGFMLFYSPVYLVSASLSIFFVPKNKKRLSNILLPNDPFQKYLKI